MCTLTRFIAFIFFITPLSLHAQIRLPSIISDNMILQQHSRVALWGWAEPGENITISPGWSSKPVEVKTGSDGKWMTKLSTPGHGGPYTIRFKGTNVIEVKNVLLGEVWLASGQSNMEFFIGKMPNPSYNGVINHDEVMADANHSDIRTIDVPNKVSDEPLNDFAAVWKLCTPATVDTFSAVAYFFARAINKATGYPVGIINATWGGTPAESWTKKDVLQNDSDLQVILTRYQKQVEEFPAANEKYRAALDKWRSDSSKTKGSAPAVPMGPANNKSPYKLYNGMIRPIEPYTIRGVIWYQGESNADRAWQYRKLFPAMINNWRKDWSNPTLPFYFVQISPHRSQNPEIRDAQFYVYKTVPNTGMAVTTDNGDSLNIHPRNKQLVGERLSLWALRNEYGKKDLVVSGPLYRSMNIEGDRIRLHFDFDKGLKAKEGELTEFTIAGDDGNFVPAHAIIDGHTILVWSETVPHPKNVRFAWRNIPRPNFYNAAGLPASPFRTDQYKLTTQGIN
ncbi:MAG: sialate O-acetylesterase [Flavisolibacter sp.]